MVAVFKESSVFAIKHARATEDLQRDELDYVLLIWNALDFLEKLAISSGQGCVVIIIIIVSIELSNVRIITVEI